MIVLAIAGLIMLIVFMAVPSLQQNRRNHQRKNDIGKFLPALDEYASLNYGAYPVTATEYISFRDTILSGYGVKTVAAGGDYSLPICVIGTQRPVDTICYNILGQCGASASQAGPTTKKYAVWTQLEGGGFYCLDNK